MSASLNCFRLASALAMLLFAVPSAFSLTYYVDPVAGIDSNPGTKAAPWKTITKAKTSVSPGDTVNLRPGNYGKVTFGQTGDRYGSAGNYITYQNAPENSPLAAKFNYIEFVGAKPFYIAVSGFEVYCPAPAVYGIKINDGAAAGYSSYIKILNCSVHGNPGGNHTSDGPSTACIGIYKAQQVLVEGCDLYNSGGTKSEAIYTINTSYLTVRHCRAHHILGSAMRLDWGGPYLFEYNIIYEQRPHWGLPYPNDPHGSGFSIRSNYVTLRGNVIYNYGDTRPFRWYQSVAGADGYHDCLVENNLVYKTTDFTGTMWWPEVVDAGYNFVIRNNTFIGAVQIHLAKNADGSGLTLYNNVVTGSMMVNNYGTYYPEGSTLKSQTAAQARAKWDKIKEGNNFYGSLVATGGGYQCTYSQFSSTSTSRAGGTFTVGSFFSTPPAHWPFSTGYPYQLKAGSPAIAFANKSMAPASDLLEKIRDTAPDAGCYEFGATGTNPPPAGQNQVPAFTAVSDKIVEAGTQLAFNISASDPEGQPLTYSAQNMPAGASFSNNQFAWTPSLSQEGSYTVTFTASDGELSSSMNVTVTVSAPAPPGKLLGYWKMDEGSGTALADASGLSNTAGINGCAWTTGRTGYALNFNGTSNSVNCGSASNLNITGNLTVAAWIYMRDFGSAGYGRIFDKGTGSTGFSFFVDQASQSVAYVSYGGDVAKANMPVSTNAWHHVAAVYNTTTGQISFYVDGQSAGTGSYARAPGKTSGMPLILGMRDYDKSRFFNGIIDEARIYNMALSQSEIAQIYSDWQPATYTLDVTAVNGTVTCEPGTSHFISGTSVTLAAQAAQGYQFVNWSGDLSGTANPITFTIDKNMNVEAVFSKVNTAPVFDAVANQSAIVGSICTFRVKAIDADNDTITYGAQNLPSGAAFEGDTFTWIPSSSGTYEVSFTATDGKELASTKVVITVGEDLLDDLVLYMKLDDSSPDGVLDSSTYSNHGTTNGSPSLVSGYFKNAYSFNGTSDAVIINDSSSLNLNHDITMAAWIYPRSFGHNGYGRIIDKGSSSTGFSLFVDRSANTISYVAYGGNVVKAAAPITLNKWQHVAVVYSSATANVTFYIDGRSASTHSYTRGLGSTSGMPLVLGMRNYDKSRFFDGLIDDVVIYKNAMTASEIADLLKPANSSPVLTPISDKTVDEGSTLTFALNATDAEGDILSYSAQNMPLGASLSGNLFTWTPAAGQAGVYDVAFNVTDGEFTDSITVKVAVNKIEVIPEDTTIVLDYLFDDNPLDGVLDSSAWSNHGATSQSTSPILVNGAYLFNGTNTRIATADSASLRPNLITLSAWVYLDAYKSDQTIIAKEFGTGQPYSSYRLCLSGSGSKKFQFRLGTAGSRKLVTSNADISLKTWTHVAATYDGSKIVLYINGRADYVRNYVYGSINFSATPVYVGYGQYDNSYFAGMIDELKVYNRALDSTEIATLAQ